MNLKYKIISILLATIIVFTVKNNVNNTNYIDNDNVSNKATETIENIIEPEIETTERIITQKTTKKNINTAKQYKHKAVQKWRKR